MQDLRKIISKAAKKMWAELPEEEARRRRSKGGKKGGKSKWDLMTPKERHALITKMTKARLLKYGTSKKKSNPLP